MPDNTHSPGGVFLSYARTDTDAARRIADALRASGIDVWFDPKEVPGGDAWDAKNQKQISECALFLPLISATTQARSEDSFRREWQLAGERARALTAGMPLLVPIVIDDTAESAAQVPEEFRRVPWTRMLRGTPTPLFVDQMRKLLVDRAWKSSHATRPLPLAENVAAAKKPAIPGWMWVVLIVVLVAVAAGIVILRSGPR